MRHVFSAGRIRVWITGAGAALFLVLLFAGAARASQFTLRVDGLACPFCAYGVEKKLLTVPGVAGIDVLINEGKIILKFSEGADLDVAALNAAVDKAGFTLRGLLVRDAMGTLSRDGGNELLLTCSDPQATFRLKFDPEDAIPTIDPGTGARQVLASGSVTDFDSRPVQLIATEIKPLRDGSIGVP